MVCRFVVALTLLVALAVPTSVAAKKGADARSLFKVGVGHFEKGEYADALANFKEALAITSRPAIYLNIARCYLNLNWLHKALRYHELYLTSWSERNPSRRSPHAKSVERQISELRKPVSAYLAGIRAYKSGDYAVALGQFLAATHSNWPLADLQVARVYKKLGRHSKARTHARRGLQAFQAYLESWRARHDTPAPDDYEVSPRIDELRRLLSSEPAKNPVANDATARPPGVDPPMFATPVEQPPDRSSSGRATGWLYGAIAALGVAAGMEAMAQVGFHKGDGLRPGSPEHDADFDTYRTMAIAGHIGAGVGAAAAAACFYFYFTSDSDNDEESSAVSVSPLPGGAFVGITRAF